MIEIDAPRDAADLSHCSQLSLKMLCPFPWSLHIFIPFICHLGQVTQRCGRRHVAWIIVLIFFFSFLALPLLFWREDMNLFIFIVYFNCMHFYISFTFLTLFMLKVQYVRTQNKHLAPEKQLTTADCSCSSLVSREAVLHIGSFNIFYTDYMSIYCIHDK